MILNQVFGLKKKLMAKRNVKSQTERHFFSNRSNLDNALPKLCLLAKGVQ